MTKGQRWETRPLESWNKAKEMRAKFEKAVRTAEQEKVLLAQGGDYRNLDLRFSGNSHG